MKEDEENSHANVHAKAKVDLGYGLTLTVFGSYSFTNIGNAHYYPTYVWSHGEAYQSDRKMMELLGNIALNWRGRMAERHQLGLLGLIEGGRDKDKGFYATSSNINTNAFGYDNLSAGAIRPWGGTNSFKYTSSMKSYLMKAQYTFDDRYTLNISTRLDGSFLVYNQNSKENIFTIPMNKNLYSNQQQNIIRSLHYRHAAAYGYNGENGTCATLKTLQVFGYPDDMDPRFVDCYHYDYVHDSNGKTVTDRTGKPLKYEPDKVQLDLSGSPYLETAGARMYKYEYDKNAIKGGKLIDNDIVLFRYADVLLMRAECKERLGKDGSADFNAVRSRAGATPRECTLGNILNERLLELCWEGWRRPDLIRFGQYKSLYEEPDAVNESDGHTTVFPIPAEVLALNNNLTQNPGY